MTPYHLFFKFSAYVRNLQSKTLHQTSKNVKSVLGCESYDWLRAGFLIKVLSNATDVFKFDGFFHFPVGALVDDNIPCVFGPDDKLAFSIAANVRKEDVGGFGKGRLFEAVNKGGFFHKV